MWATLRPAPGAGRGVGAGGVLVDGDRKGRGGMEDEVEGKGRAHQ
jgi:hypothetical protein